MAISRERAVIHQDCSRKMASVSPWKTLYSLYRRFSVQVDALPSRGVCKDGTNVNIILSVRLCLISCKKTVQCRGRRITSSNSVWNHSNELAVPTSHVTDMSNVLHECTADCNRHNNLLSRHTVHSALVQYLPLDVSQLLLDDGELRGESHPIGVARKHIHKAEFHVVHAHLSKDIVKTSFSERY